MVVESAWLLSQCFGDTHPPHLGHMVGDRPEDEECAHLAGLSFEWAKDWRARAGEPG